MLTKHRFLRYGVINTLLIMALSGSARAQQQFAGWVATFQNYKLSPRVGLYFDAQWRSTPQVRQMNQLLLRPGVHLYLTPSLTFTAGYGFLPPPRISKCV